MLHLPTGLSLALVPGERYDNLAQGMLYRFLKRVREKVHLRKWSSKQFINNLAEVFP